MLTDRDASQLVNMHSHVDDFKLSYAIAKVYTMKFSVSMHVRMPFLTNAQDVPAGALLVLPYDAGLEQIFWATPALSPQPSLRCGQIADEGYSPTATD